MEIRDAVAEDASAACRVLRRSITQLCVADHRNDPKILARWLRNKTPEIVASWIAQAGNSLLVAVEKGSILAVGAVTDEGEITLNYVSPDARFRGVSRALLGALEARAIGRGNARCTLISSETARRFYLSAGYTGDGPPVRQFGTLSYPMSKRLGVQRSASGRTNNPIHEANRRRWDAGSAGWARRADTRGIWRECHVDPSLALHPAELNWLGDVSGRCVAVLGSGDNQVVFALAGLGAKVTSVDISEQQIKFARTRAAALGLQVEFRRADVVDLCGFDDDPPDLQTP
jgi:GNAT superfamily N-acetyltransferase